MYVWDIVLQKQIETKLQLVIFFCTNHGFTPMIQFYHEVSDFGNASRRLFLVFGVESTFRLSRRMFHQDIGAYFIWANFLVPHWSVQFQQGSNGPMLWFWALRRIHREKQSWSELHYPPPNGWYLNNLIKNQTFVITKAFWYPFFEWQQKLRAERRLNYVASIFSAPWRCVLVLADGIRCIIWLNRLPNMSVDGNYFYLDFLLLLKLFHFEFLSDMFSDILFWHIFDILFWHIFCHSFWHSFWRSCLTYILTCLLTFLLTFFLTFSSDISSNILFWHIFWHF